MSGEDSRFSVNGKEFNHEKLGQDLKRVTATVGPPEHSGSTATPKLSTHTLMEDSLPVFMGFGGFTDFGNGSSPRVT